MDSHTVDEAKQNIRREDLNFKCKLPNCELCLNGTDGFYLDYEMKKHGWRRRLIIAFNTITKSTGETWLSLMKDIYPFVEAHWKMFWPNLTQVEYSNWKKKVQDSLSHSKEVFESGTSTFGKKGYWRLIEPTQVGFSQQNAHFQANFSNINIPSLNHSTQQPMNIQMGNLATNLPEQQRTALPNSQHLPVFTVPQFQFTPSPVFSATTSPWHQFNNSNSNIFSQEKEQIFGSAVDGTLAKDFNNYLVRAGIKPRSKSS